MSELKISVLVSGGGTNFQAVADAINDNRIHGARIVQLISSSEKAYALKRAEKLGIPGRVIKDPDMILPALQEKKTDLVVLAGYLKILDSGLIRAYRRRIINIHPSLLPKFGGDGMYGIRVHQAVIAAGEKESGATVHYVDEGVDTGEVIRQERLRVREDDTPETLAARVLVIEHRILPEAVGQIAAQKI